MTRYLLSFIAVCFLSVSRGQDTLNIAEPDSADFHNRKKSALLSAILPGSGQIYNEIGHRKFANKKHRSWWKVPLIYGGLGVCGYYFYQNNKSAELLKQEYLYRQTQPVPDDANLFFDERFKEYTSTNELIIGNGTDRLGFDTYSKRRDYFLIGFIGVWTLNVIEAYVDAHFVTFDVSEDLSFSWGPSLLAASSPGLRLQLNFQ